MAPYILSRAYFDVSQIWPVTYSLWTFLFVLALLWIICTWKLSHTIAVLKTSYWQLHFSYGCFKCSPAGLTNLSTRLMPYIALLNTLLKAPGVFFPIPYNGLCNTSKSCILLVPLTLFVFSFSMPHFLFFRCNICFCPFSWEFVLAIAVLASPLLIFLRAPSLCAPENLIVWDSF